MKEVILFRFVVHLRVADCVVVMDGIMVLDCIVVLESFNIDVVLGVMFVQGILINVLNLTDMMVHRMVLLVVRLVDLLNHDVVMEVMKGMILVVLLDHVVPMIIMMFGNGRRLLVNLWVVVHVRGRMMGRWLRLMMAMLMVNDGLLVDAIVVINHVLTEVVMVVITMLVVVFVMLFMMVEMVLRLLVVICNISDSGMVDFVILVELVMHIGVIVMAVVVNLLKLPLNSLMVTLIKVMALFVMWKMLIGVVLMNGMAVVSVLLVMADGVMVLLVVVLVPLEISLVMIFGIVELGPMMCIMVIRVGVLDVCLMIVDSLSMVWVCKEVDWLVIRQDFFMFMMSLVIQEVLR